MRRARILRDGLAVDVTENSDGGLDADDGWSTPAAGAHWLPAAPGKVVCVALNHRGHLAALGDTLDEKPYVKPPAEPVLFLKPPNTLAGHGAPLPAADETLYAGGALAVVIGRTASRVAAGDAAGHIGGYSVFNDLTLAEDSYFRPAIRAKCRDGSGVLGPWVVSPDGIDPDAVTVRTRVDGVVRSAFSTAELLRDTASLIESISRFMRLDPGDVLVTGFPAREVVVAPGQEVRIDIDGVGELMNRIGDEADWLRWRGAEAA